MSGVSQVSETASSSKSGDSDLQEFLAFIQEMLVQTASASELESCTAVPKLTHLLSLSSVDPALEALGETRPERLSQPATSPTTQASEGETDPTNRSADSKFKQLPEVHSTRQPQSYQLPRLSDLQSL